MTSDETMKILAIVQATFPTWKVADADKEFTLKAWHTVLSDYPYEQIAYALKAYIKSDNRGFAPSPGQLINMLVNFAEESAPEEGKAWAMVYKAICNGAYNAKSEFEALPAEIQKAVGCHEQIRTWATDSEFNEGVTASNFKRAYRQILERKKEEMRLGPKLVHVLEGIGNNLALTKGD